jgi:hypothetical protein
MARAAGVDYRQTAMAKAHALSPIVDRGRGPHTFVVAPAMLDSFQHRANTRLRI